ncbi:hypothetical protein F3Y22_tig00110893pilonHSYRG00591 [Hibiscus syriacus]|uniref:Uncharacterized protein n=1 Tax=Hibiscus syriacus TaxID=106335 RepID=A0A6A2ZG32_HIBSY|nr:hypothetical protein F3Y22_tig00110893pilonHSYRG00591 [Hibiscus syriacus]
MRNDVLGSMSWKNKADAATSIPPSTHRARQRHASFFGISSLKVSMFFLCSGRPSLLIYSLAEAITCDHCGSVTSREGFSELARKQGSYKARSIFGARRRSASSRNMACGNCRWIWEHDGGGCFRIQLHCCREGFEVVRSRWMLLAHGDVNLGLRESFQIVKGHVYRGELRGAMLELWTSDHSL